MKVFRIAVDAGSGLETEWKGLFEEYSKANPDLSGEIKDMIAGRRPEKWVDSLPVFAVKDGPIATRSASGKVLNAIAKDTPFLIGGSADLAPSTNTIMKGMGDFIPGSVGRNLHFGVREHAMGSILNGIALSSHLVPYGATFLLFSDYMRTPIRLAASWFGLYTSSRTIPSGSAGTARLITCRQLAGLRAC